MSDQVTGGRTQLSASTKTMLDRLKLPVFTERRSAFAVGLLEGCSTVLLYAVGWGRAFGYDASRTVGGFVTVPRLSDTVSRQDSFNNHPLFSLVEHLIYVAAGSSDERILRAFPIACGGLTVALVTYAVATRFTLPAGAVAGATLAVNSMAVRQFREVRGYSLVTLAAVVATLALFRRMRGPSFGVTTLYVIAVAVAVATHLFALGVVVVHVAIVLGSRPRAVRPWLVPWATAIAAGSLLQLPALVDSFTTPPDTTFHPAFPLAVAGVLLSGGPALPGMLILVTSGWIDLRTHPWLPWAVGAASAMIGALWLLAPSGLSPRFFIWLAPAVAAAAGAGVARRPRLAYLAAVCVALQLVAIVPGLTRDDVPNRIAAGFVREAMRDGVFACGLGRTSLSLRAYVPRLRVVRNPDELRACDVAVDAAWQIDPLRGSACRRFAYVLHLPAAEAGALFADRPLRMVPEHPVEDARWEPTTTAAACTRQPNKRWTWTFGL